MKSLFEIMGALHSAGLRDEYLALRHYIDERDALLDQQNGAFTVIAGKYSESFDTLDEAIAAYDKVNDYPWAEINYKGRVLKVH